MNIGDYASSEGYGAVKAFYRKFLEWISFWFGENVTFNGGLSLQTEESWIRFWPWEKSFNYQNNTVEFYFETKDFDGFIERTKEEELDFYETYDGVGQGCVLFMIQISM